MVALSPLLVCFQQLNNFTEFSGYNIVTRVCEVWPLDSPVML